MHIPYTIAERPDTGFTNGKLGMYLFMASEIMFFGGLFSAYAFLRTAAPTWPPVALPLGHLIPGVMTAMLVVAHAGVYGAAAGQKSDQVIVARMLLAFSTTVSLIFLALLLTQYRQLVQAELQPRANTYVALYYALTGLHGLHVAAAIAVQCWFILIAGPMAAANRLQVRGRLELLSMFWLLLVILWLAKFVLYYVV
jgi:heme/copper-type cytochrome/quinol oxidase subunit 3